MENRIACDKAGLNSLLIDWVSSELSPPSSSSPGLPPPSAGAGAPAAPRQALAAGGAGAAAAAGADGEEAEPSQPGEAGAGEEVAGEPGRQGEVLERLLALLRLTGSYSITGGSEAARCALLGVPGACEALRECRECCRPSLIADSEHHSAQRSPTIFHPPLPNALPMQGATCKPCCACSSHQPRAPPCFRATLCPCCAR